MFHTKAIQNKFIKRYAELKYDIKKVHENHNRVKRSLDNQILIEFYGLEKYLFENIFKNIINIKNNSIFYIN